MGEHAGLSGYGSGATQVGKQHRELGKKPISPKQRKAWWAHLRQAALLVIWAWNARLSNAAFCCPAPSAPPATFPVPPPRIFSPCFAWRGTRRARSSTESRSPPTPNTHSSWVGPEESSLAGCPCGTRNVSPAAPVCTQFIDSSRKSPLDSTAGGWVRIANVFIKASKCASALTSL